MARDHRSTTSGETAVRENTAKFRWQVLRRHVEDGTPLTQLAAGEGIGVRTLQRWLAAYRRDGVAGLLPVVPKRARHTHPELQTLIEGLALSVTSSAEWRGFFDARWRPRRRTSRAMTPGPAFRKPMVK